MLRTGLRAPTQHGNIQCYSQILSRNVRDLGHGVPCKPKNWTSQSQKLRILMDAYGLWVVSSIKLHDLGPHSSSYGHLAMFRVSALLASCFELQKFRGDLLTAHSHAVSWPKPA